MATAVESGIKQLVKEQLHDIDVATKFQEADGRFETIQRLLEELSGKTDLREVEIRKLEEALEQQRREHTDADLKAKEDVAQQLKEVQERVNRIDDDASGGWGLKQVRQQVDELTSSVREMQPRLDDCTRTARDSKTRTDEFEAELNEFRRHLNELQTSVQACDTRMTGVEETCHQAALRVAACEDSLAKKYEILWEDVANAIQELQGRELDVLRQELERKYDETRREANKTGRYALQMVATAMADRRHANTGRKLVEAWREQTWLSAKRRLGIWALGHFFRRQQRDALGQWKAATAIEHLSWRLNQEFAAQIPDVEGMLEASGLTERCSKLEDVVQGLDRDKASVEASVEALDLKLREEGARMDSELGGVRSKISDHIADSEAALGDVRSSASQALERIDAVDGRLVEQQETMSGMEQRLEEWTSDGAKTADVLEVRKDVVMFWSAIKQLDAAKADRKEVDALAVENGNRDQHAQVRAKELRDEVSNRMSDETRKVLDRCGELNSRLEENSKTVHHWEQMWEKLSGYVEELVSKVSDLKPPQNAAAEPTRSGSEARILGSSRNRTPSRSRADLETTMNTDSTTARTIAMGAQGEPTFGAQSSATISGRPPAPGRPESAGLRDASSTPGRSQWMNGAKAVVDAHLDQALDGGRIQGSALRPSSRARPKSASASRPHDRGRF